MREQHEIGGVMSGVTKCYWIEEILRRFDFQRVVDPSERKSDLLSETRGVLSTTYLFVDDGVGYDLLIKPDVRDTKAFLVYKEGRHVMRATIFNENGKDDVLGLMAEAKIGMGDVLERLGAGRKKKLWKSPAAVRGILQQYFWEKVQSTGDDAEGYATFDGMSLGDLCGRLGSLEGEDIALPRRPHYPENDTVYMIAGAIQHARVTRA